MYCGRWHYGPSVEIFHSTCAKCPILSLEEGKQCEFLSIGIRAIQNYIGGQNVDVAMTCEKLGKTIHDLRECEKCPDRSSEFLSKQVIQETKGLLEKVGFEGALEEFNDAYKKYIDGDIRGSITSAASSFESTMKSILIKENKSLPEPATARNLIRKLQDEGYIYPFLENFDSAFVNILQGLSTIRNKLSMAHGVGIDAKKVENSYGEFALHLAGSFNLFLIKRYLERRSGTVQAS